MGKGKREKKSVKGLIVSFIINLSFFILWTLLWGYFLDTKIPALLRNLLLGILGAFAMSFSFWTSSYKGELSGWNEGHAIRYSFIAALCAAALSGFFYVPFLAAPAAMTAVIMTVFSGGFCGLVSYLFILMQYALLGGLKPEQVIALAIPGLLGIVLFKSLDRELRYAGLLFAYLVSDFACCSLYYVMADSQADLGDSVMYVGIRLFSELVIILIVLKLIGKYCIYRDEDFYKRINSPDYGLLVRLKQTDKETYIHAVHTAYLSEKISQKIKIDTALAKAGGYYHKIGVLEGADTLENTLKIGRENKFPKPLMRLLEEYGSRKSAQISKEAAVVRLSDEVISYISGMFAQDNNAILDYDAIIEEIIFQKMNSREWQKCVLTMGELYKIKEGLAEVKLYYDFLR